MLLGVDHFVIAVGDLAAAMRDYAALGFSVVLGGRHAADTRAFRRAGVAMTNPKPSVRTRPDGYAVKWVLALAEGTQRGVAPFLIRDEGPRAERVSQESRHANGVTRLAAVTVAVTSVGEARGWYEAVLGHGAALDPRLTHGARLSFG